ncbi:hypothetical protein [Burkholderia pseudomallei]|uniref:hypothetical protein n=1 Tax=Burkholderia pseudomallei TaxID=28450 RepID=UPI00014F89AB|nr:hypothetical protein [Burkholderia pseudomallei]EBA51506.1 hypothetical protein BURPS305_7269 [Burkholderia pseudomallei 305]EIF70533.1 hypothetical protein BP354E_5232 [Burkholderia pseudomallei 354e]EIF72841.1 hypothetical protein BP354A_5917 [Burkholderia pseudomallei 354a]AUL56117.1 hypothetical protein BHT10_09680 [Burkholderia pseudomallei]AYX28713.1 hypothetical protein EGY16_11880 [Burkholderia pseudomallei]
MNTSETSGGLRRRASRYRISPAGQQTYIAGRARWRNYSHQLAHDRRMAELAGMYVSDAR